MHSQFLEGFKCESQTKNNGKARSRSHSLARSTQRGRGACWSSRMGLKRINKLQLLTQTCTKATRDVQCIVGALSGLGRTIGNFGFIKLITTRTWGKPPPSPFQYILQLSTGATSKWFLSRDSQMGVPKFSQLGLPRLWRRITWHANL